MSGFLLMTSHAHPGKGGAPVPSRRKRKPRPRKSGPSAQSHGHSSHSSLAGHREAERPPWKRGWRRPWVDSSLTLELPGRMVTMGGSRFLDPKDSLGSLVPVCSAPSTATSRERRPQAGRPETGPLAHASPPRRTHPAHFYHDASLLVRESRVVCVGF